MDPRDVTLDDATARKLAAEINGGLIRLRDPAGRVIGYCLNPVDGQREADRRAELAALWPPEEIARLEQELANDPRPDVPHDEVIRWVKGQ